MVCPTSLFKVFFFHRVFGRDPIEAELKALILILRIKKDPIIAGGQKILKIKLKAASVGKTPENGKLVLLSKTSQPTEK